MKIYRFEKRGYGRFELLDMFDTVMEARIQTGCKNILRCLFREIGQTNGYIFTLNNDERIVRTEDGNVYLDCVDYITIYPKDYDTLEFLVEQGVDIELPEVKIIRGFEKTKEFLERVEEFSPTFKYSITFKPLEKKFDTKSGRIECWYKDVKIGVFDNVAEARKVTGASCIWANVLGECKTTKGFVFKLEESENNKYFND